VLIGLPTHVVSRLQSVQNVAVRLIFKRRRFDHITDALITLHWLRVPVLVVCKIDVLTFKVFHVIARQYIGPVVRVADLPGRQVLRFAGTNRLVLSLFKRSTIGIRAFPVAGPVGPAHLNSLPADIT